MSISVLFLASTIWRSPPFACAASRIQDRDPGDVPRQFEAITLLIPNQPTGVPGRTASDVTKDSYLRTRIRAIAEIRQRTGLDLLPAPPFDKATLEQAVASDLWPRN